mmetsp:Transcript_64273/g.107535  ORF Transcript_64273/g.107535 Transcript_64273/m.107535 type:complete len:107 (-) Transcript_64273:59-379(-)
MPVPHSSQFLPPALPFPLASPTWYSWAKGWTHDCQIKAGPRLKGYRSIAWTVEPAIVSMLAGSPAMERHKLMLESSSRGSSAVSSAHQCSKEPIGLRCGNRQSEDQ